MSQYEEDYNKAMAKVAAWFKEHRGRELCRFERIKNPKSKRPMIHAFLVLDDLVPGDKEFLQIEPEFYDSGGGLTLYLESEDYVAMTEDHVIELLRCGINYDHGWDTLIY